MRPTMRISFGAAEVIVSLPEDIVPWSVDEGRRWLDEKFSAYECEPVRASGKVLTADKLLALATEIGPDAFASDERLRLDYARAALAALGREHAHINVDERRVST